MKTLIPGSVYRWLTNQYSECSKSVLGHDKDAHLSEIAQFADKLIQQTRQVPSSVEPPVQRNRFQRSRRTAPFMKAQAEQKTRFSKNFHYVTRKPRERPLSKQGSYGNDYKTQLAVHCRVCLAKDN